MFRFNMDESWNSDYDSTWEDEEPPEKKQKHRSNFVNRPARDMQNYRHEYGKPSLDTADHSDSPEDMPNLLFYKNEIAFEPYGDKIENFHRDWWNDYQELEQNHSFIQWLFPLREPGVNPSATPLTPAEIKRMRADEDVRWRLLESYKLMLGFYGIKLLDKNTGEVSRADNWKERYHNLNRRNHNNLRITRILKCLGEMGYDHFQAPLVQFFLEETLCNNQLPNVKRSVLDYFMFTVKDKQQRRKLVHFAWESYKPQESFIWGPVEKLQNLTRKNQKENEGTTEEVKDGKNPEAPSTEVHQDLQQKTRIGEDTGDNGGSGVDRTGDHEDSEHKDTMAGSRNDKQTTEGNSSGNDQLTTVDNSLENKNLIIGVNPSTEVHQDCQQDTRIGEDMGDDSGSGVDRTQDHEGSEHKDAKSSKIDKQTVGGNSSGNDQLTTVDNSLENKNLIIGVNPSTEVHEDCQQDTRTPEDRGDDSGSSVERTQGYEGSVHIDAMAGSRNDKHTAKGNSSGNMQLVTEENSSGIEKFITEDNSSENEIPKKEDNSLTNKKLITVQNILRNEKLKTEDNSSGNNNEATESTNLISHKMALVEDKKLLTQGIRNGNDGLTTEETSFDSKNTIKQTQPGAHQAEDPRNEEEQKLVSRKEDGHGNQTWWEYVLSLRGLCCWCCVCSRL
ncbi:uncharacterized protein LOC142311741 [Anomaloglossus baeobatrachus]|uniref:uncharacterized protein LOC142311741 n=1 Tax=Anomaloglossus baeobatrachus TaxID=238106 RepID=UPI003F50B8E4